MLPHAAATRAVSRRRSRMVRRLRNGPGAIGITYVQDAGRGCRTRTSSGYAAATHAPVPTEGEQVDGRL